MGLKETYDWIIIGSGFGGSVSALRLAEKGYTVLVIEKGKEYGNADFAKTNWNIRKWFWIPALRCFGIQKLSFFRHITILSGVGVGGGSLVYANTLLKPRSAFFKQGSWAELEDWEKELAPYYEISLNMLGGAINPVLGRGDLALQELARKTGREDHFTPATVSVFFGEPDKFTPDPFFNGKGPDRKGCIHCGACMTGCRNNAKNSLDKNYLHLARQMGVTIIPEHEAVDVLPFDDHGQNGYKVTIRKSTSYFSAKQSVSTRGVIFSGGVLGTVPLLLKLRRSSLPLLSPRIGDMVRSNNEALIVNTSIEKNPEFHKGLAIGSILEPDENSHLEPVRYGEGSGFWRVTMMPMVNEPAFIKRIMKLILLLSRSPLRWLKVMTVRDFGKSSSILLFMQHVESTLKFRKGIFGLKTLIEKGKAPTPFMKEASELAKVYSGIINAESQVIATETITGIPSTAHILGGACMGRTSDEGAIDSNNKVFGYENMYVFDGSVISANPGVNPSLTITAIAERGISKIPTKIRSMDAETIVQQQKDFFKSQRTKDLEYRRSSLKRLRKEIVRRQNEIIQAIHKDFRKSEFESVLSETTLVLQELDRTLKNLKTWMKPKPVIPVLLSFPSTSRIYREPYGSVLIISPWNYPFQLVFLPLIGAVAAGNTAVIKPSEFAPHTGKIINEIISAAFEKNHVCLVEGDGSIAERLLKERWDYIFFTGSVEVGKLVAKAASEHLTPFTLELGGKNPCIIDETANIKLAAKRIAWGKFINGGQSCVAPDYILVHKSVKADFIAGVRNEIIRTYGNDPRNSADFPRIINMRNFEKLQKMLLNEKVVLGGENDSRELYIAPTIVDDPLLDSEVMKREIFGPILPVIGFTNEEEVTKILSGYEKPLALYVFSAKKRFKDWMIRTHAFGGGTINDTIVHFANHRLPFGGVGHSGNGSYHGRHTFETFSHKKGITHRYNWLDIQVRYAPYNGKLNLLKAFLRYLG